MKACKHQNCAVCSDFMHRDVFKSILGTLHPDVYLCGHVAYEVTSITGQSYVFYDINSIRVTKKGLFILDMCTGDRVPVTKDNFTIMCSYSCDCDKEPVTQTYKRDG